MIQSAIFNKPNKFSNKLRNLANDSKKVNLNFERNFQKKSNCQIDTNALLNTSSIDFSHQDLTLAKSDYFDDSKENTQDFNRNSSVKEIEELKQLLKTKESKIQSQ